jgi:hypothetical protein
MPARPNPPTLSWTVHPAVRDPARTVALVGIVGLAILLTWTLTRSPPLAALAAAGLLGSLRAWFLPRRYVLDERGARVEGPLLSARGIAWERVRAVTRERHGVHVSPLHRSSRWLPDRGLFLRTDDNAADVAAFVASRTPAP